MTHAITRTSPKGGPFIGRCIKCGQEGLGMGAPLEPCPMDAVVSDEQALLDCLERDAEAGVIPAPQKEVRDPMDIAQGPAAQE